MVNVDLGTNISFAYNAIDDSNSALSYSWSRLDNVYDNPIDRFTGQNTAMLNIADVGINDAKTYVCSVTYQRTELIANHTINGTLSVIGEW